MKIKILEKLENMLILYTYNPKKKILEDIYDGKIYQFYIKNKFLKTLNQISFCLNTDGISLFSHSKTSFWLIYLIINELPKTIHFKKENIILFGMWFDINPSNINTFVAALVQMINEYQWNCCSK